MESNTSLLMHADRDTIYRLAADVARWPIILPHYRWVRVLEDDGVRRTVQMAARRDVIPVRWTSTQELRPEKYEIAFHHIGGVTTGMDVLWTLNPTPDGVLVNIWHDFRPHWPVPDALVGLLIGDLFIHNIASKTLGRIKQLAEAEARDRNAGGEVEGARTIDSSG